MHALKSGSTGKQTALLFMIRYAHPRVQYLAMLPVYWVLCKKGARLELAHSDVKGSGWLILTSASDVRLRAG